MDDFFWTPELIAEYRRSKHPTCFTCLRTAEPTEMMYEIIWDGNTWMLRQAPISGYFCHKDGEARIGELNSGVLPESEVHTRMVPEKGIILDGVFVSLNTLGTLSEQRPFDSEFGAAILLSRDESRVLVSHGLAIRETRGGYHASPVLEKFMENLEM